MRPGSSVFELNCLVSWEDRDGDGDLCDPGRRRACLCSLWSQFQDAWAKSGEEEMYGHKIILSLGAVPMYWVWLQAPWFSRDKIVQEWLAEVLGEQI